MLEGHQPLETSDGGADDVVQREPEPDGGTAEDGQIAERHHPGRRAGGHPGEERAERADREERGERGAAKVAEVEQPVAIAKLAVQPAEPLDQQRPQVQQLDLGHRLGGGELGDEVRGPPQVGRPLLLLGVAVLREPPLEVEKGNRERRDDEHDQRLDGGQHEEQRDGREQLAQDVQRLEHQSLELDAHVGLGPGEEVLALGILEEGQVERPGVREDLAGQVKVEVVGQPLAGVADREPGERVRGGEHERERDPAQELGGHVHRGSRGRRVDQAAEGHRQGGGKQSLEEGERYQHRQQPGGGGPDHPERPRRGGPVKHRLAGGTRGAARCSAGCSARG